MDLDRLWVGMVSDGLDSEYRLGWIGLSHITRIGIDRSLGWIIDSDGFRWIGLGWMRREQSECSPKNFTFF